MFFPCFCTACASDSSGLQSEFFVRNRTDMRVIVVVARHHDIVFHPAVGELGIYRSFAATYHEVFFAAELCVTSVRISMGDEIYNVLCPLKSRVCRKVKIFHSLHVTGIQSADILVCCRMKVYKKADALIVGSLYRFSYRIDA